MVKRLIIFFSILAVLCSCEHKDLCLHHPHTAKVRINVDWTEFIPVEQPTGMTVMVFPEQGGEPVTQLSNTISHVYADLNEGYYHSIAFNQSTSEFGSLQFSNMDDYANVLVYAETTSTKWYTKATERVAAEPEWFAADRFEMAHVTKEMVEKTSYHYGTLQRSAPEFVIGTHTPLNVIYTVHIKVEVDGIQNLRSARGALQGMAEGYYLSQDQPLGTTVTHLVESWSMTKNALEANKGYITATIHSFGLPAGHQAIPKSNIFTLSFLLSDNKTQLDYTFEVGDKWILSPDKELTLYLNLAVQEPLPDVIPDGSATGGFDATVKDWGDEEDHDILM